MYRLVTRLVLTLVVFLFLPFGAFAQVKCSSPTTCGGSNGHNLTENSLYPFSEDISTTTSAPIGDPVTIYGPTSDWTIVQTGCQAMSPSQTNIVAGGSFNARLLGYLRIDATSVSLGAQYEVQFLVDGVAHGWYVRAYQGMLPQGDHFNVAVANLSSGNHVFQIQARLLGSGWITFGQQYITSIGAPSSYPAVSESNPNEFTVNGTWQQASDTITFSNTEPIDIFPQAYFQMDSGTAGDWMSFGFSLDGATSVHTSDFAAPPYYRDGINVFDHLINVPAVTPGTNHTLSFWLIDRNGNTMNIRNRQIELVAFPAASAVSSDPIMKDGIDTTQITVDSSNPTQPQPTSNINDGCGGWTQLLEFTIPAVSGNFNWTGDGFVELLGRQSGDWSDTQAQLAIELVTGTGVGTDVHWVQLSVPQNRGEVYFYADAMLWGNGSGQTARLWMRKTSGCGGTAGAFNVGKRYLALKLVPTDGMSCYVN